MKLGVKWIRLGKLCSEQKIVQRLLPQKFRLLDQSDDGESVGENVCYGMRNLSFDSSLVLQMTLREHEVNPESCLHLFRVLHLGIDVV